MEKERCPKWSDSKEVMGMRLKELCKQKGIKGKELAKMIGKGASTVSQYMNGKRQPTPDTLIAIADALDVSIDELFEREPRIKTLPCPVCQTPIEIRTRVGAIHHGQCSYCNGKASYTIKEGIIEKLHYTRVRGDSHGTKIKD